MNNPLKVVISVMANTFKSIIHENSTENNVNTSTESQKDHIETSSYSLKERIKEKMKVQTDAKKLLLADYRYLSDSFWKNEQTGETRVNIFIGIVTLVVGGLVTLCTSDKSKLLIPPEAIPLIIVSGLSSLLILGIITLFRIIKRNESTDLLKKKLDQIRQIFKDRFDAESVLSDYAVFIPESESNKKADKKGIRKFGGLAHLMAGINSILFSGVVVVLLYFLLIVNLELSPQLKLIIPLLSALIFGILAFYIQFRHIQQREQQFKSQFKSFNPTHAGGVVFRKIRNTITYCLVQATRNQKEYVLPKGKIEENEDHAQAALREVREEAGVMAQIHRFLDTVEYTVNGKAVRAKYYLMEEIYSGSPQEQREPKWLSAEEAINTLQHPENGYLIAFAAKILNAPDISQEGKVNKVSQETD